MINWLSKNNWLIAALKLPSSTYSLRLDHFISMKQNIFNTFHQHQWHCGHALLKSLDSGTGIILSENTSSNSPSWAISLWLPIKDSLSSISIRFRKSCLWKRRITAAIKSHHCKTAFIQRKLPRILFATFWRILILICWNFPEPRSDEFWCHTCFRTAAARE